MESNFESGLTKAGIELKITELKTCVPVDSGSNPLDKLKNMCAALDLQFEFEVDGKSTGQEQESEDEDFDYNSEDFVVKLIFIEVGEVSKRYMFSTGCSKKGEFRAKEEAAKAAFGKLLQSDSSTHDLFVRAATRILARNVPQLMRRRLFVFLFFSIFRIFILKYWSAPK
eukprot:TRINITY_DN19714_c0_g1_i2.p1 TRINITY_DN19714_c0_g1~~TRINITY_DN19714_c0_g1_i2.p1  ORF type:complete len:170 (-),score=50.03 TRINITY_DN19714_c0_g1_i2:78-587(-)